MNLKYAVMWNTQNPETTWSGTGYSLYKALDKKCNLDLINTMPSKAEKLITSWAQIRAKNGKIYREKNTYNKYLINVQCHKLNKLLKKCAEPLLSIARAYSDSYYNQYIYMDMNAGCMMNLRKNHPELSKYLPFSETNDKVLEWQFEFQKRAYSNCKALFTMGEWVRDEIIADTNFPAEKVFVVGSGINIDKRNISNSEKRGNKILFVGKDFYRKGGDITVSAFQLLKKEMPEIELYILGPQNKPIEINQFPDGIYFLGQQPFSVVSEYFNKCDIFCMPSRFEAYGIVFAEALVYGLPCIANNAFAMKEFICDGQNGYLLHDYNVVELKNKMRDLLINKKIKQYVHEHKNEYINKYSWDTVAEKILTVINSNK